MTSVGRCPHPRTSIGSRIEKPAARTADDPSFLCLYLHCATFNISTAVSGNPCTQAPSPLCAQPEKRQGTVPCIFVDAKCNALLLCATHPPVRPQRRVLTRPHQSSRRSHSVCTAALDAILFFIAFIFLYSFLPVSTYYIY